MQTLCLNELVPRIVRLLPLSAVTVLLRACRRELVRGVIAVSAPAQNEPHGKAAMHAPRVAGGASTGGLGGNCTRIIILEG